MKTYCCCKKKDFVCRGLQDELLTFKMDYLWVHATCCLPFYDVWYGHVRRCEGCLGETCLPWEPLCYRCHKIEYPTIPYNGLLAASKRARDRFIWPIPKTSLKLIEAKPKVSLEI